LVVFPVYYKFVGAKVTAVRDSRQKYRSRNTCCLLQRARGLNTAVNTARVYRPR